MPASSFRSVVAGFGAMSIAVFVAACSGPPIPHGTIDELFPAPPQPVSQAYTLNGHRVHYLEEPGSSRARILFIHGTPGEWRDWAKFMADPRLQAQATMIAVDRPGFGKSDPGKVVPGLVDQARLMEPLLRGKGAPTIVVGHSLGGPIAARMAMDYPAEVRAALLIAPAIDPATEQPRWYNVAMTWRIVQWFAPSVFDWSNREIMPLDGELKAMLPLWKDLKMPVTVIQGEQDQLVDPRTADFAQRMLPADDRIIRVPGQGHFVLWEKPQIVVDALLDLLKRSAPPTT